MTKPTYEELERRLAQLENQTARQQATETQLTDLFFQAPLGIACHRMIYDGAGRPVDYFCLNANSAYQKNTGVNPVGRRITDVYPGIKTDPCDWIGSFGRVVATGEPLIFSQHFQTNNRWYEGVAYRSKPDHFMLIFFEITENHMVDASLRESNANDQQVVDAMQELLFVVEKNGNLCFANQHASRFLAADLNCGVIGRNLREFIAPHQAKELLEGYRQVLATNQPQQRRILITTGSGSGWFDNSLTPIHYGSPPRPAVLSLMLASNGQDIQQEFLRRSDVQYRTLFESMQEGAIILSSPTELLGMNPASQRILGCSPAELQHHLRDDKRWCIAYENGTSGTHADNPIARCFATGQAKAGTILKLFNPKTNRYLWIIANVTPYFRERSATPYQVIATFNDITDQIHLRKSRQARHYLLENCRHWSLEQLLQQTIDKAGELFESPIGFFHLVNEDEQIPTLQTWSLLTRNRYGDVTDHSSSPPVEIADVWLDCLCQRRPVIHNDYASSAPQKDWPTPQIDIVRVLATPIFRNDRIVAILGIGNKTCAYTEEDLAQVQHFANSAWGLVEHKQLEEVEQESRQKLRALISNLPGMVFSVENDDARTIQFVSDGCQLLTGYSAEELMTGGDCSLTAIIHPQDRAQVLETVRRAVTARQSYQVEYRLLHADGKERAILERGSGEMPRNSERFLIEGFAIDITEQKNAAQRIAASHQQLLTILDSIEAQVFVADMATHEVLFMNKKTKELFGANADHLPCHRIFQNEDEPCDFCTNDRLLDEQGEPGPACQWEHRNPITGRWHVNHDRAVRWLNGNIVRMQVAFDDTERKETELQLRQVQKMEAIGLLASGVAHDFNNILSVILGYTTMALQELGATSPRINRDLLEIQKAGMRAKDLVSQILTFSHQTEEHFQPMLLHLLIKEVVKMLHSSFPATIQINAQIAVSKLTILADPTQIHQVLMNLATNALHAMKDGGALTIGLHQVHLDRGPRRAELQELPTGSYARLSVQDTGTGIPTELLDYIFEPFFTTKGSGEGTGLGLSMVQGIVARHKGAITVDNRPGEGTAFSLYFPEINLAAPTAVANSKTVLPCGTETILVVDDEPAVALIMQRLLTHLGYTVEAYIDSVKAFEAYALEPEAFDLVITDMTMPKKTGMTLAWEMLDLRPDQPIILCTGFSEAVDKDSVTTLGIKELLIKPIAQETLAETVRQTLDRGSRQASLTA